MIWNTCKTWFAYTGVIVTRFPNASAFVSTRSLPTRIFTKLSNSVHSNYGRYANRRRDCNRGLFPLLRNQVTTSFAVGVLSLLFKVATSSWYFTPFRTNLEGNRASTDLHASHTTHESWCSSDLIVSSARKINQLLYRDAGCRFPCNEGNYLAIAKTEGTAPRKVLVSKSSDECWPGVVVATSSSSSSRSQPSWR